jgi:hypothetical protein
MTASAASKIAICVACAVACDGARAPEPVGTSAPSVLPAPPREDASVVASASAAPPDVDLAGAEAKCANARGDVVVLSLLTSCPSGAPKNGLNCQGSYDGWDLWWGTGEQAEDVRRAGCPTAILCARGFWSEWRSKHEADARAMIDHAEKRALPRPSGTPASPRVYSCMF